MAGYKLKTHRGAAKRFALTRKGKVRRAKAFARHLLTKKSAKRKRNYRGAAYVSAGEARVVRRLLPNG
jgi:large subunit ribosomal protein L35